MKQTVYEQVTTIKQTKHIFTIHSLEAPQKHLRTRIQTIQFEKHRS